MRIPAIVTASLMVWCAPVPAGDLEQAALRHAEQSVVGVQARVVRQFAFGGQVRQRRMALRMLGVVVGEGGRIVTGPIGDDPQGLKVFVPGSTDGVDAEVEESGTDFSVIVAADLERRPIAFDREWKPAAGEPLVWVGMLPGALGKWTLVAKGARADALLLDEQTDVTDAYSDPPFSGPVLALSAPVFGAGGRPVGLVTFRRQPGGGAGRRGLRQLNLPVVRPAAAFADLLDGSARRRGILGVSVESLGEAVAAALGLEDTPAVVVTQVTPGSGAEEAGLKAQDMIVKVDGTPIPSGAVLRSVLRRKGPGDTVKIELLRDEGEGPQPVVLEAALSARDDDAARERFRARRFGFVAQPLTSAVRRTQNLPAEVQGVYVRRVTPGGPAALARPSALRRGDVVLKVADRPTPDLEALKAVLAQLPDGKPAAFFVRNRTETRFVEITPEK